MKHRPTSSIVPILRVCGAIVLLVSLMVAMFVRQHRQSQEVSAAAAAAEFRQLREQFAGQPPLVDMRERRPAAHHSGGRNARLRTFHTVVFDTAGGERIVRMSVPYWFGRLFARHEGRFLRLGELTFLADTEFDAEPIDLALEDIERHGPGLLVSFQRPSGGQFLAWVD